MSNDKCNDKCDFCGGDGAIMSYASPGVPDCRMCKACENPSVKKKKIVWDEKKMRSLLMTNNHAVQSALVVLYKRQTDDEKNEQNTKHTNNVGFSGAHANQGSYLAKWVLSGKNLSGKFLDNGRKIVLHYVKQLTVAANNGE